MTTTADFKLSDKEANEWDPGIPFFVLDSNLCYLYLNPAFASFLEVKEKLVGLPFWAYYPDGKSSKLFDHLNSSSKTVRSQFDDFCVSRSVWYRYIITPKAEQYSILVVDVTSEKNEEICKSRDEIDSRQTFESCDIGVARIALDGRWLDMNPKGRLIFRYQPSGFQGRSYYEAGLSKERAKDEQHFADMIDGAISQLSFEKQIIRSDGERTWIHLRLSLVRQAGRPLFFVAIFEDIHTRKANEESLQFALDAAQLAAWDYDVINNQTRRSQRFNQLFGYQVAPQSWGFGDFLLHVHPEDRSRVETEFSRSISTGQDLAIECRTSRQEERPQWISIHSRIYQDDHGRTVRMAGLLRDVSAEKQAEGDIQSARLAAEDANREKSYFLANMSHEIRTPLSAILGYTSLIKDYPATEEDRARSLEIIYRNSNNLASLIDKILDLSKVEAGCLEMESGSFDLGVLLVEVLGLLRVNSDAKGIELTLNISDSDPCLVWGDPIRVRQILFNVIGNAIKFTSSGQVQIRVQKLRGSSPELLGLASILVEDTGCGIPFQVRGRLFQPFAQADASTSRVFGGTGLGLALSRRLAFAMGGSLELKNSEEGRGSVFEISLPQSAPGLIQVPEQPLLFGPEPHLNSKGPTPIGLTPLPLRGMKILLAEDSPDNQHLIESFLSSKGAEVTSVSDGATAVSRAQSEKFDLILMDMQMPVLDGYRAARELRRRGHQEPIVAITAHAMRHDRARCLEAGCTDYLAKPIAFTDLLRVVAGQAQSHNSR